MPAWPSLNYRVRVEQTNSLQEKKALFIVNRSISMYETVCASFSLNYTFQM